MTGRSGTKYDDWGWHIGGDYPSGQPEEHGLVHMAAYFVWIARRGWLNPELFDPPPPELQPALDHEPGAAIRLMEAMDGKLVDELMTEAAPQFSDYYYADGYLADWANAFADFPPYGVTDVRATHERIQPTLDARYEEWERNGRPTRWPHPGNPPPTEPVQGFLRQVRFYAVLFGTIIAVAVSGVVLNLRGFPWPLVQVAVVMLVLFLPIRAEMGRG